VEPLGSAVGVALPQEGQDDFTVTVDGSKVEFAPGVLPQISGETLTVKERIATGAVVTDAAAGRRPVAGEAVRASVAAYRVGPTPH
jgi:hypothetical protein